MNQSKLKRGFIVSLLVIILLGITLLLVPAVSAPTLQAPGDDQWYHEDSHLNTRITAIEGEKSS